MIEMPLIYGFGVLGLGGKHNLYWGFGQWHFLIGVLSRDLCYVHVGILCQYFVSQYSMSVW